MFFKGIDNDHLETPQRSFSPMKPIPDGEGDRNLGLATISRTWSRTWAKVSGPRVWWGFGDRDPGSGNGKFAKPPRCGFSGAFF